MCVVAGGGNFNCPIPGPKSAAPEDDALAGFEDDLSRTIVDCEVNSSAWTLMHRYNKATELLDSVLNVSFPHSVAHEQLPVLPHSVGHKQLPVLPVV